MDILKFKRDKHDENNNNNSRIAKGESKTKTNI